MHCNVMYICISHKGISWDLDLAIWKLGSENQGCRPRNGNLGMETDVNWWKGTRLSDKPMYSVRLLILFTRWFQRAVGGHVAEQFSRARGSRCWVAELGWLCNGLRWEQLRSGEIHHFTLTIFTSCARPHLCSCDSYGSSWLHEGSAVAIWLTKDPHICWSPNHES